MYWSDDDRKEPVFQVPDDIVDVSFAIKCPTIPLDHAHALSAELLEALPWLGEERGAGVHLIHGAASGNGWFRPEDAENEVLHLSRRTRMRLRVPSNRLEEARSLSGRRLDISGHALEVGKSDVHLLSSLPTLFARYVITEKDTAEEAFLARVMAALQDMGINCRKMLCGITHTLSFPDGPVYTRSLMVADLEPEQSVQLQQSGLGEGREFGCGLFIPHKGIKPVKEPDGE
jgi:CRISPR-associated protein Cas6